jgi:AAA ATPase domain
MADSVLYFRVWDRLQLVFRRFINVFARPEHPLAVFLDDLQWLDAAPLDKALEMKVSFYAAHLKDGPG